MNKIFRVLKENWIKYGFETVVVTVGLLGAFALEGWRESRKEEKELLEIYQTISNDLQSDALALDTILDTYEWRIDKMEQLVKGSVTVDDWLINDSMFSAFTGYMDFQESLRGLDLLKLRIAASGETGNLAGRIIDFYNVRLLRTSVKKSEVDNFLYDNYDYWIHNTHWFSEAFADEDLSSLASYAMDNPIFRNRITAYLLVFEGYYYYLGIYKDEGRKLAEEINAFLEAK